MITRYHRPHTLEDALALLADPGTVALGGGTTLVVDRDGPPIEVVDLQALPLAGIEAVGDTIRIGATTRLQDIVDAAAVPSTVRDLARREAPRSIRNAATVAGTIAVGDPESEFVAGLLALDARVAIARDGDTPDIALDDLLGDTGALAGGLVTAVTVTARGHSAAHRTGRTPMDRPIVAVVAHREGDRARIAASGVAERPILVDPDAIRDLDPPSDFRGTAEYRRVVAEVLVERALVSVGVDR